jgi:hypothetical protein
MAVHLAKAYKTVPKMRGSGKTKVLCICVTGSSHVFILLILDPKRLETIT